MTRRTIDFSTDHKRVTLFRVLKTIVAYLMLRVLYFSCNASKAINGRATVYPDHRRGAVTGFSSLSQRSLPDTDDNVTAVTSSYLKRSTARSGGDRDLINNAFFTFFFYFKPISIYYIYHFSPLDCVEFFFSYFFYFW